MTPSKGGSWKVDARLAHSLKIELSLKRDGSEIKHEN